MKTRRLTSRRGCRGAFVGGGGNEDFERRSRRCPTWSCKKRLQEKLREVRAQFTQIDSKLMNRRP